MISFSHILVAVDLSHADRLVSHDLEDSCKIAVQRGIDLAKTCDGQITFFASLDISEQAMHLIEVSEGPSVQDIRDEALEVMSKLVEQAASEGITATAKIEFGCGWKCVTKEVLRGEYTLVVTGRKEKPSIGR